MFFFRERKFHVYFYLFCFLLVYRKTSKQLLRGLEMKIPTASLLAADSVVINQAAEAGLVETSKDLASNERESREEVQAGDQESDAAAHVKTLEDPALIEGDVVPKSQDGDLVSAFPKGNESHWLEYATLMGNTLPVKSKVVYMKAYAELETYLRKENQFVQGVIPSEHALLNYFFFLKNVRQLAPSTIWYY